MSSCGGDIAWIELERHVGKGMPGPPVSRGNAGVILPQYQAIGTNKLQAKLESRKLIANMQGDETIMATCCSDQRPSRLDAG